MAAEIIAAVKSDATSRKRIEDSVFGKIPASWGAAGLVRNVSMFVTSGSIITGEPASGEDEKLVCTGIADATVEAINRVKIAGVVIASAHERILNGSHHTGTKIDLSRFGAVVFDWWSTLRIDDPLIYRTVPNFNQASGGVLYSDFKGF